MWIRVKQMTEYASSMAMYSQMKDFIAFVNLNDLCQCR